MEKDSDVSLVVVDNPNTTPVEIAPYVLAAEAFGYAPEIITDSSQPSFGDFLCHQLHGVVTLS